MRPLANDPSGARRAAAIIASLFTRRMVTRLMVTGLLALDFYCLSIIMEHGR